MIPLEAFIEGFLVFGAEIFFPCSECGPESPREDGHPGRHRLKGLGGGKW